MNFLEEFKKIIWNKDSTLDNWLKKKLNAYGWRGFVANLIFFGSGYVIFFCSPEIIEFFDEKLTPSQMLTHQARMFVVNKVGIVILIMLVLRLVKQYSKEERKAHQEKSRKDALMEAEIKERQKNNE